MSKKCFLDFFKVVLVLFRIGLGFDFDVKRPTFECIFSKLVKNQQFISILKGHFWSLPNHRLYFFTVVLELFRKCFGIIFLIVWALLILFATRNWVSLLGSCEALTKIQGILPELPVIPINYTLKLEMSLFLSHEGGLQVFQLHWFSLTCKFSINEDFSLCQVASTNTVIGAYLRQLLS